MAKKKNNPRGGTTGFGGGGKETGDPPNARTCKGKKGIARKRGGYREGVVEVDRSSVIITSPGTTLKGGKLKRKNELQRSGWGQNL